MKSCHLQFTPYPLAGHIPTPENKDPARFAGFIYNYKTTPFGLARDDNERKAAELQDRYRHPDSCTDRHLTQLPRLAPGSRHAHADEQPRSQCGRKAGRVDYLRRNRQSSKKLGLLRQHHQDPAAPRKRRDADGAERQTRRRIQNPRGSPPGADRQLQPGTALGQLGRVQGPGTEGTDHVRTDDGRLVDLYRLAGHRPGHLRNLRRTGQSALRRQPRRQTGGHGRAGRNGRRTTAGGDHE